MQKPTARRAQGPEASRRTFLHGAAGASVAAALAACGSGTGTGPVGSTGDSPGTGTTVSWGAGANPGEAERFREYSADYEERTGVTIDFQNVVGDYGQKLLTQLAGGTGPDAFYVNDTLLARLVETGQIMDLSEYLARPDAAVSADDPFPGLLEWARGADGDTIYGMPVDCNPKVFWYNKKLLDEAGVPYPADQFEAGTWNQDALTELLTKVRATGKRAMALSANWFDLFGLLSTLGGTIVDEADGRAVFHEDPRSLEVLKWLWEQMDSDNITFAGSLPQGQDSQALFLSDQIATVQVGRWILPNLLQLGGDFIWDIAPMPSQSGGEITPTSIYSSVMAVNAKARDAEAALEFMGNFVNADGQRARLTGGGNAVPAVGGLEEIVTEGAVPEHAAYFVDVVENGFTTPTILARNPEVASNYSTFLDELIRSGVDSRAFAEQAATEMNGGK